MEAKDFSALRISLASPEQIRSWSYGEVTKPETINYRRLRPEKDGLFCEAIFGPTKDYQCYCGKYKNVRYKGIICDKCGVEVTRSSVRRERLGHIELAAPVAHVWYTRRVPSYLGILLDVSRRNLDRVLYFAQYVITHVDEEARQKALKRIEEDLAHQEATLRTDYEGQQASVRSEREEDLGDLEARVAEINQRHDDEQTRLFERVMAEAQSLQDRIEAQLGKRLQGDLFFESAGVLIAGEGDRVENELLQAIQTAAKERLSEIQEEIEARRRAELERLDAEVDQRTVEAADAIQDIQTQLERRLARLHAMYVEARDELLSLEELQFLGEPRYRELKQKYGQVFKANMGAEAFLEILKHMDLEKLSIEMWHEVRTTRSKQRRKKAVKRLRVVESLIKSNNRPEWMILTVLPVIPPDLRPMVQLDGGRFATSDLNDLYRRVINRNNRLKRLLELGAPDVIVRNEKRMLQEAVDSLIDNSQRGKALSRRGRRELKSLSDMLKGKKGRFRRNLLGKRVDYSGRSVIVIGPKLKLHQCGLPKIMALELYRPFVISRLVQYNYASNVKGAKRIIERERPEVWEVLEEVIKERPVLLNRAPTLHRLGIQAFEPILVEGKAIQIHPLVCAAFNADFDGDQMAVHVPLSQKAVEEARELMLSTRNLLKPADGSPVVAPSKDMVLGNYYLTMDPTAEIVCLKERAEELHSWEALRQGRYRVEALDNSAGMRQIEHYELDVNNEVTVLKDTVREDGRRYRAFDQLVDGLMEGRFDAAVHNAYDMQDYLKKRPDLPLVLANLHERRLVVDMDEVDYLYGLGEVDLHTPILLGNYYDDPDRPPQSEPEITTVGRALFNRILPDDLRFVQDTLSKKSLQKLVSRIYQRYGPDQTTEVVDAIKNIGFHYATVSGTTIAVSDLTVPQERDKILSDAAESVEQAQRDYRRGLLTEEERYQITIDSWNKAKSDLKDVISDTLDPFGPIAVMALSGSTKGGFGPITQLAGMRGLMADPSGRIIEMPITSHFRMGLTALEYFISTHGARKGLADTALRTADAGYMTRRLVDVAQDVIVNRHDCGTRAGIKVFNPEHPRNQDARGNPLPEADVAGQTFEERIIGRAAARDVHHPETGETIVRRNEMIDEDVATKLEQAVVDYVYVRSPMTCALVHGICAQCYGRDLGRGELVEIGSAVGIVAAQSIGEPGTQLTLRTFHTGGVAGGGDITSGLPRVEELFEARKKPKGEAVVVDISGTLRLLRKEGIRIARVINSEVRSEQHEVPDGWTLLVEDGDTVKDGQALAQDADGENRISAGMAGEAYLEENRIYIRAEIEDVRDYEIPQSARLLEDVSDGIQVTAGQQLTEGSKNPHRILRILGQEAAQHYLLTEVQKVYRNQGVNIADKHFEVIIRKMMSKVQITRSGDSELLPGELIDKLILLEMNERLVSEGKEPASAVPVLLGITKAALTTDSFLSASSFQHTIKVLAGAAIEGKVDHLYGLKENVIIGKLIPAGTGFHTYQDRDVAVNNEDLEAKFVLQSGDDEEEDEDEDLFDEAEELGELPEPEDELAMAGYSAEEEEELEDEEDIEDDDEEEALLEDDSEEEMTSLEIVAEDEEEAEEEDFSE
ncbi:MAG TPA: DNA-directed RNA polymerase subunit beta' [Aggregatilineaceae bacterium]|nr:DNA-directed RNA polymerase subunit beta' [Aggregatilineaceae bacterium]